MSGLFVNRFELGPSRRLSLFLACLFAGAIWVVLVLKLPWILIIVCLWRLIVNLRLHALLTHPDAVQRALKYEDNTWLLINQSGQELEASLCSGSVVTSAVMLLNFKVKSRVFKRALILLPDNLHPDDFRRLRVQLSLRLHAKYS